MGARPLPLSTGLADLFSLSDDIEALGDREIEGSTFESPRALRERVGAGDASYTSSPKGEGDSESFVDRAIINRCRRGHVSLCSKQADQDKAGTAGFHARRCDAAML
jgi:hypothetical protein